MPVNDMPPGYWADYEDDIRDILTTNVVNATEDSIIESLRLAGADLDGVSDELLNRIRDSVTGLTADQADRAAKQIREVTQTAVQEKINDWYESGERTIDQLTESLSPYFGDARARRIAITETTRSYADQNIAVWKELKYVTGKRWQTARDDLVCPICRPQHGDFYPLDSTGFMGLGSIGIGGPPAHVNCLVPDTDVLPGGNVIAASRRHFQGYVVTIRTLENELTVTPNHPILTLGGWVLAQDIIEGMNVFGYDSSQWVSSLIQVNKQQGITPIQDIFSSLEPPWFRMPTPSPYFYDYRGNLNIAVIRTNSEILNRLEPRFSKPVGEPTFFWRYVPQSPFSSFSPFTQFGKRDFTAPDSGMSGGSLVSSLVRTHSLPFSFFGFRPRPDGDTPPDQAANPIRFGQGFDRFPVPISLKQVTNIGYSYFSGYVYNLESTSGVYMANNILTHNCRCWLKPVYEDM